MNKLPHFLIGGAARTATTWLCHALLEHPEIYLPRPLVPEPKFFARPQEYEKGLTWYAKTWFDDAKTQQIRGEKSTSYLETVGTAKRIHAHLPDVKLIFILRNPADRALSNYYWSRHNGIETESFERAIELEEERTKNLPIALQEAKPFSYLERGFYAKQLQPYFELFPKQNILCLKTEDIDRNPQSFMGKTLQLLGLSESKANYSHIGNINVAKDEEEATMTQSTRKLLDDLFYDDHKALVSLLGEDFLTW